jgi:hypothetical protein
MTIAHWYLVSTIFLPPRFFAAFQKGMKLPGCRPDVLRTKALSGPSPVGGAFGGTESQSIMALDDFELQAAHYNMACAHARLGNLDDVSAAGLLGGLLGTAVFFSLLILNTNIRLSPRFSIGSPLPISPRPLKTDSIITRPSVVTPILTPSSNKAILSS